MRKICLVGQATRTREWAHRLPEDVELWGQNETHLFQQRWDRWFQVHPRNWRDGQIKKQGKFPTGNYGRQPAHIDFLNKLEVPLYLTDPHPDIENYIEYPYDHVVETVGVPWFEGNKAYLTSTTAYMLALALTEHVDHIEEEHQPRQGDPIQCWDEEVIGYPCEAISDLYLAGIEMAIGTEYSAQKPCVEYYMGYARGLGINVHLPPESGLLSAPVYAKDHHAPFEDHNFERVGNIGQALVEKKWEE